MAARSDIQYIPVSLFSALHTDQFIGWLGWYQPIIINLPVKVTVHCCHLRQQKFFFCKIFCLFCISLLHIFDQLILRVIVKKKLCVFADLLISEFFSFTPWLVFAAEIVYHLGSNVHIKVLLWPILNRYFTTFRQLYYFHYTVYFTTQIMKLTMYLD